MPITAMLSTLVLFLNLLLPVTCTPIQAPLTSVNINNNEYPNARPSWFTSNLQARRLLALSTTGVASTIFPSSSSPHTPDSVSGHSIALKEYYADCSEDIVEDENGNPTFLALNIGTTFRNVAAGSNVSLSIDWWDNNHHLHQKPVYPGFGNGNFPQSQAGLPRVTLLGYVEAYSPKTVDEHEHKLEECFLRVHPDASAWVPSNRDSPHRSFWARLLVTQVYWIGGFGDVAQIGWMNVSEWKGIGRWRSDGVGDGRGWEDVRLPGEEEL